MKFPFPEAALQQHTGVLGKTGSGKSSVMRGIVEHLLDEKMPVSLIDPKGDWWGLKLAADGKHPGYPVVIFGGAHADVPIDEHSGAHVAELVATGNRPCIIDLGTWMIGERTRFFIQFASNLFKHSRGMRWLVIDEVHNFAPQGKIFDVDAGKMLHWANRLASEGRGKGIQILAASQRPQKVHKDFLDSCETLVAMRSVHPRARAAIKEWLDGAGDPAKASEIMSGLAAMPRGTGWVWSPEIEFGPKKIAFPMFGTYDSFKPQSEGELERLKGWAEVDLDEVKAKLATVVKEAEENDPRRLKARIRELEQQQRTTEAQPIDHAALEQAEVRGRMAGRDEVLNYIHPAHQLLTAALSARAESDLMVKQAAERLAVQLPPLNTIARAPVRPAPPTQSRPREATQRVPAGANGSLSRRAERMVLTVLAQYPQGRSKTQVAVLAGYSHSGGGFNNAIGALRSSGYIDGDQGRMTITPVGRQVLGPVEPLPRGRALLDYWLRQLDRQAERKTLEAVCEVYPRTLSKQQIAARAGYEPDGGGFNNALGKLRSLELVKGSREIRASEDLFDQ